MARKSKGTSEATPKSTKRKIDWSTIDENGAFEGFELRPPKSTKKQRTETPQKDGKDAKNANMGAEITQKNVFEDAQLSTTHWRVHPEAEWEGTGRYRKFTIDQAEFEVGDNVFIKPDASQAGSKDAPVQGWVARVLEVRAGDPNHVYLRIYWLYRPEDLPGGRRPYHGYNELIASNDMAIIDAMTVDGPANVIHWQEQKDQGEVLNPAQLFWRQTLDVTKKPPALSELPQHCIDFAPCNPDELLVQCESCDSWLHGSCLEDDALRDVYKQHDLAYPDDTAQTKPKGAKKKKRASKLPPAFSAQIVTTQSGKTRLTVTDKRSGAKGQKSWDVPVKCLLCPAIIEKVVEVERVQRDSEETESASDRAEIPTSATVVKDGNVPATPANKDEEEDDEDSVVGNDISSPVKEELPDRTANPLEAPDVESAGDANTNGYSQNTAKKRKRGATDGSTKSSTGKKRRATDGAANLSAEKKFERPITPAKETAPDASVLHSGVKTLKRMLWQSK